MRKVNFMFLAILQILFLHGTFLMQNGNNSVPPSGTGPSGKPLAAVTKRALLVGIGYETLEQSRWESINALASVTRMANMLVKRAGFAPQDIKVLSDSGHPIVIDDNGRPRNICGPLISGGIKCDARALLPTKANIIREIEEFLIRKTVGGEDIVIYFIGHGQSVVDTKKIEPDGCDETLVPFDFKSKDTSNNILDDEIGGLLDKLEKKNPRNVTIIFDSCQSGSAIRGADGPGSLGGHPACSPRADGDDPAGDPIDYPEKLPKNFVYLSASSAYRKAFLAPETTEKVEKGEGLFTRSLVEVLETASPSDTYRKIIETVRVKLADTKQNPQATGDVDTAVLGGSLLPVERFIPVTTDNGKVILGAGSFRGITRGSRFEIYPPDVGTREKRISVATAIVVETTPGRSILKIVTPRKPSPRRGPGGNPTGDIPAGAVAYEIEHNYDSVLKIAIRNPGLVSRLKGGIGLSRQLAKNEIAQTAASPKDEWNIRISPLDCTAANLTAPDICGQEPGFRGVILQRRDGFVTGRFTEGPDMLSKVEDELRRQSFYVTLRGLIESNSGDHGFDVRIRMLDAGAARKEWSETNNREEWRCKQLKDEQVLSGKELSAAGDIRLKPGQCYAVELVNAGSRDAYITLINWEANDHVKGLFPSYDNSGIPLFFKNKSNLLSAESRSLVYLNKDKDGSSNAKPLILVVTEIFGQESLWALATREDYRDDLSVLIDSTKTGQVPADVSARGPLRTPLETILTNGRKGTRSRGMGETPGEWAVFPLTFTVVKHLD
jgi:Caspase domain